MQRQAGRHAPAPQRGGAQAHEHGRAAGQPGVQQRAAGPGRLRGADGQRGGERDAGDGAHGRGHHRAAQRVGRPAPGCAAGCQQARAPRRLLRRRRDCVGPDLPTGFPEDRRRRRSRLHWRPAQGHAWCLWARVQRTRQPDTGRAVPARARAAASAAPSESTPAQQSSPNHPGCLSANRSHTGAFLNGPDTWGGRALCTRLQDPARGTGAAWLCPRAVRAALACTLSWPHAHRAGPCISSGRTCVHATSTLTAWMPTHSALAALSGCGALPKRPFTRRTCMAPLLFKAG